MGRQWFLAFGPLQKAAGKSRQVAVVTGGVTVSICTALKVPGDTPAVAETDRRENERQPRRLATIKQMELVRLHRPDRRYLCAVRLSCMPSGPC